MHAQTHAHTEHGGHDGPAGGGDKAGFHGMVLWGADSVYLSHLPMFRMKEHAYQVIIEADLARPDGGPAPEYAADRAAHPGQRLYSVAPADFVLPDIFPRADGRPAPLAAIHGPLFRNRFDQNGAEIAPDVVVDIKNVVHSRKFDLKAPPLENLEYIVFGKPGEIYLAHLVTLPPDFDHIVRINLDHDFSDGSLGRGLPLRIPGRRNDKRQRLATGEGQVPAALLDTDGAEKVVRVEVVDEVFFNDDPADFDI